MAETTKWREKNFRLSEDANRKLTKALTDRGRELSDVARKLFDLWVTDESIESISLPLYPPKPPRTLNKIITGHLVELLQQTDWLPAEVVLDVQLFREGHSVFGTRIDHFRDEKQRLARGFADFIVKRAVAFLRLKAENHAYLCADSGTGLYWMFRFLPDALIENATVDELRRIHIVTNNVAGSECYGTRSQQLKKKQPDQFGHDELSEVVRCTLLGGDLLPKYSAVTGKIAEDNLRMIKAAAGPASRFFGAAVGHWIDLAEGSKVPTPLARGPGQVPFKETLIRECDEVFILAPLGKLFIQPREVTERELAFIDEQYLRVPISDPSKVKLVTSCRSRGLLRPLSNQIQERYQQRGERSNPAPDKPIDQIGAILFDFDHRAELTTREQIELDFPHDYEWKKEFLTSVFSVELENWAVLKQLLEEHLAQEHDD